MSARVVVSGCAFIIAAMVSGKCDGRSAYSPSTSDSTITIRGGDGTPVLSVFTGGTPRDAEAGLSLRGDAIELTGIAVLGGVKDPAGLRDDAMRGCMLAQLSGGAWVVSAGVGLGSLLIYPPNGGSIQRLVGRLGQGPGEFKTDLRVLVGPGDSLHVVDGDNGRVQVLAPAGAFVRSFSVPTPLPGFALLHDGSYVYHRYPLNRSDPVFAVVDATGHVVSEFGSPLWDEPDIDQRIVGAARDGGFWASTIWEYAITKYALDGTRVATVRREADWFPISAPPPSEVLDEFYLTRLPPPLVRHIWEDEEGRLWVYSQVPDENWKAGAPVKMTPEWGRRTFDTILEVIDPGRGLLVGRIRLDDLIGSACNGPWVYLLAESASGDNRIVVLEPHVVEP